MSCRRRHRPWQRPAAALLLVTLFGAGARAAEYFVGPSGSDANGGLSALGALATLGRAFELSAAGDTISLFDATYTGAGFCGASTANPVTVRAASGVAGGVIIDCQAAATGLTLLAGTGRTTLRHLHITNATGDMGAGVMIAGGGEFELDAVTVSHCSATRGGGVGIALGTVNLTDCTLSDNSASNSGGGVYSSLVPALRVQGTTIRSNRAVYGGGLYLSITYSVFESSVLEENQGSYDGGAILSNEAEVVFSNSNMTANWASWYGACLYSTFGRVRVAGSRFTNNTSRSSGIIEAKMEPDGSSALRGSGWSGADAGLPANDTREWDHVFTGTVFDNNSGGRYGAIGAYGGLRVAVSDCDFTDNSNYNSYGGALSVRSCFEVSVTGSSFVRSSAGYGAGAVSLSCSSASSVTVADSTFDSNTAGGANGGALLLSVARNTNVQRLTFRNNSATGSGGSLAVSAPRQAASSVYVTISDCSFEGSSATTSGGGLYVGDAGAVAVRDSNFSSCTAPLGGAVSIQRPGSLTGLVIEDSDGTTAGATAPVFYEQLAEGDSSCAGCSFPGLAASAATSSSRPAALEILTAPPETLWPLDEDTVLNVRLVDGAGRVLALDDVLVGVSVTVAAAAPAMLREPQLMSDATVVPTDAAPGVPVRVVASRGDMVTVTLTASTSLGDVPPASFNVTMRQCSENALMVVTSHPPGTSDFSVCSEVEESFVSSGVYAATAALASLMVLGAAVAAGLVHKHRAHAAVRAAGVPLLLIMLGSVLPAATLVYTTGLDAHEGLRGDEINYDVLCPSQPFLLGLAFQMLVGCLMVRTYRIHAIFNAKTLARKKRGSYTTPAMLKRVGTLVLLDCVTSAAWAAADPLKLTAVDDGLTRHYVCESDTAHGAWLGATSALRAAELLYTVRLAYGVRNVSDTFNESRQIGLAAYNLALVILIGLPLTLIVATSAAMSHVAACVSIVIAVVATLTIVIAPKIYVAITRPDATGNTTVQTAISKASGNSTPRRSRAGSQRATGKDSPAGGSEVAMAPMGGTASSGAVGGKPTHRTTPSGRRLNSGRLSLTVGGAPTISAPQSPQSPQSPAIPEGPESPRELLSAE